mgnify:CR=1 FL=1
MIFAAAGLFSFLTLVVCVFQAALVAGAPWGEFTQGGRWPGQLPRPGRIIAAVSILLLSVFAAIVLTRSGFAFARFAALSRSLIWIVVAYFVLGTLAHIATPSRRERLVWLPVIVTMLALSFFVALS